MWIQPYSELRLSHDKFTYNCPVGNCCIKISWWCFWKSFSLSSFSLSVICKLSIMKVISSPKDWLVVNCFWCLNSKADIWWQIFDCRSGHIPLWVQDIFLLKWSLTWAGVVNICFWCFIIDKTSCWPASWKWKNNCVKMCSK